jgi:hypothetical protein
MQPRVLSTLAAPIASRLEPFHRRPKGCSQWVDVRSSGERRQCVCLTTGRAFPPGVYVGDGDGYASPLDLIPPAGLRWFG